jgi:hypothetical protein
MLNMKIVPPTTDRRRLKFKFWPTLLAICFLVALIYPLSRLVAIALLLAFTAIEFFRKTRKSTDFRKTLGDHVCREDDVDVIHMNEK